MLLILALLSTADAAGRRKAEPPDLEATAAVLLGQALASEEPWDELRQLCDGIGHRISGSPALDRAIDWTAERMAEDGLTVTKEPVTVPVWRRNAERLTMLAPLAQELDLLGLGGSVGTPPEGVTAEVVAVSSFAELEALGERAKGRIVLFDVPFTTYGETVQYRIGGASAAARHGAVAALVRSVTPESLYTPHTGTMFYDDEVPVQIPAAAITVEDAITIHRMVDAGQTVKLTLQMGAETLPDAPSANVVGELRGREHPDEVITLGCHLDSWDVGQGAQDDGAGCVAVMEAGALLAALPVAPRRTVRIVLFTNEESGTAGGKAYAEDHADEQHVALLEMDTGAGEPWGWRVDVRRSDPVEQQAASAVAIAALAPLQRLLAPIGATQLIPAGAGADIGPTIEATGALGLGLHMDTSGYWPIHHTRADTLDKIDRGALARDVAALAVTAWWLSEVEVVPVRPAR